MSKLAWQHGALFIYIYTYIFFSKGLLAFWLTLCTCVHVCVAILARTWLIPFGLTLVLVLVLVLFLLFLCFGFGPGASEIVRRLQLLAKYFFFLHEIFYLSNPKTKKKYEKKLKKRNETKKCQAKSSSRAIKPLTATTENKIYD